MADLHTPELSIGDVAVRTGIGVSTLRMWEERYGFPVPQRVPSGHRRYTAEDCRVLVTVARERDAGASVPVAIERARATTAEPERSLFAGLRGRWPSLSPMTLTKAAMFAISRAIEDEAAARADRPVLVGAFQRERFWRASEARWRDLAKTAHAAVVLADLPRRSRRNGVWEVPLPVDAPMQREWSVVCDSPTARAVLVGTERPGQARRRDLDREFDAFWTVDPDIVREAARIGVALADAQSPGIADLVAARLIERPSVSLDSLLEATSLTNRIVAYVERARR